MQMTKPNDEIGFFVSLFFWLCSGFNWTLYSQQISESAACFYSITITIYLCSIVWAWSVYFLATGCNWSWSVPCEPSGSCRNDNGEINESSSLSFLLKCPCLIWDNRVCLLFVYKAAPRHSATVGYICIYHILPGVVFSLQSISQGMACKVPFDNAITWWHVAEAKPKWVPKPTDVGDIPFLSIYDVHNADHWSVCCTISAKLF